RAVAVKEVDAAVVQAGGVVPRSALAADVARRRVVVVPDVQPLGRERRVPAADRVDADVDPAAIRPAGRDAVERVQGLLAHGQGGAETVRGGGEARGAGRAEQAARAGAAVVP